MGLHHGDRIVGINGRPVDADEISSTVNASRGASSQALRVERDGRGAVVARPVRPEKLDGDYRLGFVLKGEGLGPRGLAVP